MNGEPARVKACSRRFDRLSNKVFERFCTILARAENVTILRHGVTRRVRPKYRRRRFRSFPMAMQPAGYSIDPRSRRT